MLFLTFVGASKTFKVNQMSAELTLYLAKPKSGYFNSKCLPIEIIQVSIASPF